MLLSAQSRAPGFQGALGELYRIYWYPLYAYVRRRGHTPEETQDLTQGFFLHLLEQKTLGRADPFKRKFHFLSSSHWELRFERTARARAFRIENSRFGQPQTWRHGSCVPALLSLRGQYTTRQSLLQVRRRPSLRQIAVSQHL